MSRQNNTLNSPSESGIQEDDDGNIKLSWGSVKRGQKFGALTVLKQKYKGQALVDALCECGRIVPVSVEGLLLGFFDKPVCMHIRDRKDYAAPGDAPVRVPEMLGNDTRDEWELDALVLREQQTDSLSFLRSKTD